MGCGWSWQFAGWSSKLMAERYRHPPSLLMALHFALLCRVLDDARRSTRARGNRCAFRLLIRSPSVGVKRVFRLLQLAYFNLPISQEPVVLFLAPSMRGR